MLTSITPLGERSRNRNWAATVTAYFAGSIAGGAAVGLVAGTAGALLPPSRFDNAVIFVVVLLVIAAEAGWVNAGPWGSRQVNENWLDEFRGWVVGAGFGFQLGLGLVTIVTSLAVPATFVAVVFSHSIGWGVAVGATFGLARAIPILRARGVTSPDRLARLHRRHDAMAKLARLATAAASIPLLVLLVAA